MKQSNVFKIDALIQKIENKIKPDLDKLEELKIARKVISDLPDTVEMPGSKTVPPPSKRRRKKRYGSKSVLSYVSALISNRILIGSFNAKDVRRKVKNTYGYNVNIKTIGVALSRLCKEGRINRVGRGLYRIPIDK